MHCRYYVAESAHIHKTRRLRRRALPGGGPPGASWAGTSAVRADHVSSGVKQMGVDGQPSSSIIEAPSGRPTSKLLAASPGPDGSPSSRAQTRGTGEGCCGADQGTGQGSYGRKPTPELRL